MPLPGAAVESRSSRSDITGSPVFRRKKPVTSMTVTSAVEFLIWLLIAVSAIAIVANRLRVRIRSLRLPVV